MMDDYLFPPELDLTIDEVQQIDDQLHLYAHAHSPGAQCPDCQTYSTQVHGSYGRHPHDLPAFGLIVRLHLTVRRFVCVAPTCHRRTFAESFPGLVGTKARRTERLKQQHLDTGYALGGAAGARLTHQLAMPISGDTLIRDIRHDPEPEAVTVRVVGIDDWAQRKGCTYGTIMVDLETHQAIDLLDSRAADEVAAWLQAHPEIEIVSRDRARGYGKAANVGAPQAEQVADWFHLLQNLREAVVNFLQNKPACLRAAAQEPVADPADNALDALDLDIENELELSGEKISPPAVDTLAEPSVVEAATSSEAEPSRRQQRYDQVHVLHQAGESERAISRQLQMSRRTVRKYLEAEQCPEYPRGRVYQSKLTPWLSYLEGRWQAGCTNASQLWREIRDQGFTGSLGLVVRWAKAQRQLLPAPKRYARQQADTEVPRLARKVQPVPWSAQRASWLLVLDEDRLDAEQLSARQRLLGVAAQVDTMAQLVQQFNALVRERRVEDLGGWLEAVATSGIQALQRFTNGLRADWEAVQNACRMEWSNGQTEGQVNRLKFVKRQMYGRAKFDLLRKRFLHRPA